MKDPTAWFGTWTQLLDRNGNKVVVFLPEDQAGLNDRRSDLVHLYEATADAEFARMRAALESISKNTCCGSCQEARLVALSALSCAKPECDREFLCSNHEHEAYQTQPDCLVGATESEKYFYQQGFRDGAKGKKS